MTKEVLSDRSWIQTYSTVTEWINTEGFPLQINHFKQYNSLICKFTVSFKSSKLTKTTHYNTYQQKLYRLVKFLKEERGIGYRRISHILTEKGYRSVRTNSILKNSYIYTIYSKGKIRENRINRSFDSKIENIKYVFKYCKFEDIKTLLLWMIK